jgi:hypothetical protein
MNTRDFLKLLLPESGWIFTATQIPGGQGWINTAHQSLDDAVENINRLTFEHKAAYYAMATYEKDRVWDAEFKDPKTGAVGKWRTRTQKNAQYMRSFYLDLDIDANDAHKFPSREQAMQEFSEFATRLALPRPMVVDSGGGFHIYWPLTRHVTAGEWRVVADQFKQICIKEGFRADRSLTSDQARVLRALGGYNVRRDAPVRLLQETTPVDFADFKRRLDEYVLHNGLHIAVSRVPTAADGLVSGHDSFGGLGDNLGATNDPLNLGQISFHCQQIGIQVGTRGAFAGEQLWRATLGIAKFCEPQVDAARAVSDGHADYDEYRTIQKMDNWRTGPTACTHFHQENPLTCETCPHWNKLTSPAQLGRLIREAPPPKIEVVDTATGITSLVELPAPPHPYKRRKDDGAVLVMTEDKEGNPYHEIVSPYDFYPTRIMRQSGGDSMIEERSMWRAHLPRLGIVDMEIPQALVGDVRVLYKYLLGKGVYLSPDQSKMIQLYMSAYLQKLAAEADRDKLYDRMGWHESHREFVLGEQVVLKDGTQRAHVPSRSIRAVSKDGIKPAGTMDAWRHAIQFYNAAGYEGARFFLYASFGAPIFHMNDTGNKGVMITASGDSGRGKSTALKCAASVWGMPDHMLVNGNKDGSTINALYEALGTYHSLPFLWDEITERDEDEIRKVLLNISQGQGKMRMTKDGGVSERRVEWETIVLASANTDDVTRIMNTGKEVTPHLMRLVGVQFDKIDTSALAKAKADHFLRAIGQNHGHAGPIFMRALLPQYDILRDAYILNIAKIDHMLNSANASAERFWTAAVAAAYTAAKFAQALDLLPGFPIESDLLWMVSHLANQRDTIAEATQSPMELLSEFLELNIGSTLVVSPKASSNLDNVIVKPHGALLIRHEPDNNLLWLSRQAFINYCVEQKATFRKVEEALAMTGVVLAKNTLKVLGADTPYGKGQTRVWKIDTTKLGPLPATLSVVGAPATNVTPLTGGQAA